MNPFYERKCDRLQVSVVQNMSFPAHLHDDMEILYCLEGEIKVTVMSETRRIKPGDCALIFPERVHSYLTEAASQTLLLIFNPSIVGSCLSGIRRYHPQNPFLTAGEIPADASLAFNRLCQEKVRTDAGLCGVWIQVAFAYLFPRLALCKNENLGNSDLVYRIVQYIMEHYREPLTLEELAEKLHVNKYYLSHAFSGRLQIGFRTYLNRIRLEYAMQLIRTTDKPLTEIWGDAGFESQRSFNRVFRDLTGMSPMEYRRLGEKGKGPYQIRYLPARARKANT